MSRAPSAEPLVILESLGKQRRMCPAQNVKDACAQRRTLSGKRKCQRGMCPAENFAGVARPRLSASKSTTKAFSASFKTHNCKSGAMRMRSFSSHGRPRRPLQADRARTHLHAHVECTCHGPPRRALLADRAHPSACTRRVHMSWTSKTCTAWRTAGAPICMHT